MVIIDDLGRGRWENLADALATGRVQLTVGDIRDRALVDRLTAGVDVICHQATMRITHCADALD